MLHEEVAKYRELSGDTNPNTPISRIGGYLDGYERALEQEQCEDAISREDALMALTGEWTEPTDELIHRFIKRIRNLPSVKPQEPFKPMVEIDLYSVIKQKYIERDVLDKIRAEIEDAAKKFNMRPEISYDTAYSDGLYGALNIIDKYRAESEKV